MTHDAQSLRPRRPPRRAHAHTLSTLDARTRIVSRGESGEATTLWVLLVAW